MTGLFVLVDRLDAAVVAHADTRQCFASEHGMPLHFVRDSFDHAARGKRFTTTNASKRFLFVEDTHPVALDSVIQKTR